MTAANRAPPLPIDPAPIDPAGDGAADLRYTSRLGHVVAPRPQPNHGDNRWNRVAMEAPMRSSRRDACGRSEVAARVMLGVWVFVAPACGGAPTSRSKTDYPVMAQSDHFEYHYAAGDQVNAQWDEAYHAWATAQFGITLPQRIAYYKYVSRQDMGDRPGTSNTNAYSVPASLFGQRPTSSMKESRRRSRWIRSWGTSLPDSAAWRSTMRVVSTSRAARS